MLPIIILIFNILAIYSSLSCFTIVIDPGHGGKFEGGIGLEKTKEKDITLPIAQKLAKLLKAQNNVILTRENDKHFHDELIPDLQIRAKLSHTYNADLFISLHANTGGKSARGFEIFVPCAKVFPAKSYQIASYIHFELSRVIAPIWCGTLGNLNDSDHGIRAAKFHVLCNHACPAILIELDYITNKKSLDLLKNPEYHQKLVSAIARGVTNYKKSLV